MSEDFDIKVKVDPGSAIPTIKSTESELARLEDTADSAQRAFAKLGEVIRQDMVMKAADAQRAFKSLGDAIRMEVNAKVNEAKAAMRSLADAIAMEARVLEQATGKARDHGFHLAALQKLHNEGRISGEQYITTLERMGVEFEQTAAAADKLARAQAQQASKTIGLPMPAGGGGMLAKAEGAVSTLQGAVGGGVLVGGIVAAGEAFDTMAQEARDAEDRVTTLTNKAQKFVTESETLATVLGRQDGLARALHSTSAEMIGVYDAIGDAVERYNISAAEQARITETVAKAARLGGDSMEGAAEIMQRLNLAFETGADTSGTLQRIFRQYKDLGDQLSVSLGLSKKEILDLAGQGKLKFEDFAHALSRNTEGIDEQFKKVSKTNAETMAQMRENFDLATKAGEGLGVALMGALDGVDDKLTTQVALWDKFRIAVENGARAWERRGSQGFSPYEGGVTPFTVDEDMMLQHAPHVGPSAWEDQAEVQLQTNSANTEEIKRQVGAAEDLFAELKRITAEEERRNRLNYEYAQQQKAQRQAIYGADSVTSGIGAPIDLSGVSASAYTMNDGYDRGAAHAGAEEFARQGKILNDKLAKDAEEAAERTRQAWAQGLGAIGADFISMARSGEQSFSSMAEHMMQQIAKLIIQMAALKMAEQGGSVGFAGTLIGGLVGGFAHGGEYTVPRSPDYFLMPRAANGNTWQFGGGGQQDEHMFMARVSSGETLEVRTQRQELANAQFMARQQQAMSAGARGGGSGRPIMIFRSDPREVTAAMGTLAGQRQYVNLERQFRRRRLG